MRDIIIIATIASVGLALIALAIAARHHLRLEWLRHHGGDATDKVG